MRSARPPGSLVASRRSSAALPSFDFSASAYPEISSGVHASHIQLRSGSAATSVSSDSSVTRPKRIPKHERHAMMESFVAKYRALNSGKFPTVSCVQKEVGGSFYIVRQILQEIEHSFKASLNIKEHAFVPGKAIDGNLSNCTMKKVSHAVGGAAKHLMPVEDQDFKFGRSSIMKSVNNTKKVNVQFDQSGKSSGVQTQREDIMTSTRSRKVLVEEMNGCVSPSSSNEHVNEVMDTHARTVDPSSGSHLGTEIDEEIHYPSPSGSLENISVESMGLPKYNMMDRSQTSSKLTNSSMKVSHERDNSSNDTTAAATPGYQIHLDNEGEGLHCSPRKEDFPSEVVQGLGSLEAKGFHDNFKEDVFNRDMPDDLKRDEPAEKKSSLWKNLKSLAGGIINFWRKM